MRTKKKEVERLLMMSGTRAAMAMLLADKIETIYTKGEE